MDSSENPDDEHQPPRTLKNQSPISPKPEGLEWANQQHPSFSGEIKQPLEDILPMSEITFSATEKRKEDQLSNTSEYQSPSSSEAKTLQWAEKLQSHSSASFAIRKRKAISDEGLTSRKTRKIDPDAIQRQPGLFAIQRQPSGTAEYKSPDSSEATSSKLTEIEQHSLSTSEIIYWTSGNISSMSGLGLSAGEQDTLEYQSSTSSEEKNFKWVEKEQQYSSSSNNTSTTSEEEREKTLPSTSAYRPPPTSSEDEVLKWAKKEGQHYPESEMMKQTLTGILSTSEMLSSTAIKAENDQQSSSTLEYQQSAVKMMKEASEDSLQNTEMKISEKMEGLFETTMNIFEEWASFEMFALSRSGLNLQQSDIDRIADENNLVQDRKRQILIKWMQNNNDASFDSLKKRISGYAIWVGCILKDVEKFRKFILSPRGLCLNALDIQDISDDDISTEHGKISIMRKKWETKNGGKEMTTLMLVALLDKYADAEILEIVKMSFEDWSSFELFALSLYGLEMQESDIARISEENDSVEERKNRILLKWMENNKNATASDLYDRVQKYQFPFQVYFSRRVIEDLEEFRKFALSPNGLCLSAFDIQDIIEHDRSSHKKKIQLIRKKWETKHEKELTALILVDLVKRYLDAAFLSEVNDFLCDVEEFKKFALSRDGLHLNESDIHNILDDGRISGHEKIGKIKSKWKEKLGKQNQRADSIFEYCMDRYAQEDCIDGSLSRRVWIPNFREKYSHEEAQPLQGKLIGVVPSKPVDIWLIRENDEILTVVLYKLDKLKRHTNVVTFIDCICQEDYIFVVMERAWTDTLSDAFRTQLDDKVSISLCLQLLKGLAFLHENDLVHHALSPKSILVSADRKSLKITLHHLLNSNDKLIDNSYHAAEYLSHQPVSLKMNVYTAGLILTEILSNGRNSFSDILSESEQKVERKILDFTHIRASNKPLVEELIKPMTKLDPESRPTVLEVLRDFTFLAYKILSESSTDTSTIFYSIIQCKRTMKNIEKTIQWRRDESGTWTQTAQAQSSSLMSQPSTELNVQSISMYGQRVTNEDITRMASKISRSFKKWAVEFCDCVITVDHLKLFHDNLFADKKITKFKVGYTRSIEELIERICFIINKCQIPKLSFEYDYLDDDAIKLLKKSLREQQVYCLEELDIRYNKLIGEVGFKIIGEIVREFNIGTLNATDCDITDDKLDNFLDGIKGYKLVALNISCNKQLTMHGFKALAETISRNGVGTLLKLSDCGLTEQTLDEFHKHLSQKKGEQLLDQLDVSYNPSIMPNTSLGLIILKCRISKLNLAGCKLSEEHVVRLRESTSEHQMVKLSMRDNRTIRSSLTEIAEYMKQSKLKELDISNCAFPAPELEQFRKKLDGAKLQRLHLGDGKKERGIPYIKEICDLLPNVNDIMYLQFQKLSNAARQLLQEHFAKGYTDKIIIKLSGGITEQWTKLRVTNLEKSEKPGN